jgi:hypothetical protein
MENRTVTIQIPETLWSQVETLAREYPSLDALFTTVIAQEIARRQAQATHERIVARRNAIRARTGPHPSAAELVHELRQGEASHDH